MIHYYDNDLYSRCGSHNGKPAWSKGKLTAQSMKIFWYDAGGADKWWMIGKGPISHKEGLNASWSHGVYITDYVGGQVHVLPPIDKFMWSHASSQACSEGLPHLLFIQKKMNQNPSIECCCLALDVSNVKSYIYEYTA